MMIIPAIDVLAGKAVRLEKGRYDKVTDRRPDPVLLAHEWADEGALLIHVVDLDGAREGAPVNHLTIAQICRAIKVPVQVGGGLRTVDALEDVFDAGATRAVLGTGALKDPQLLDEALGRWPGRIVVSIDVRDGYVAADGWLVRSSFTATDFAHDLVRRGALHLVYTDIGRDGTLEGPPLDGLRLVQEAAGRPLISAGGVGSLDDLRALRDHGAGGAIVGRALYSERISLSRAIAEVQRADEAYHPLP